MTTATSTAAPARRTGPRRRRSHTRRRGPGSYSLLTLLSLISLLMLLPFLIVAMNAVKSPQDYSAHGPLSFPHSFTLSNVREFWDLSDFGQVLISSLIIAACVAVFSVLLSILNAYAIGVGRVRGRTWILLVFLLANLLPQEALIYPLYYMAKQVGLYDNRISVIIILTVIQTGFGTYLLSSVLGTFPREILEAAQIDGAGKWRTLWRVVVPVSRPTLGVLLTFFFIWTWNEYFIPLVFLISNSDETVPVALGLAQNQHTANVTMQAASGLLGVLPAIIFFLIFQRTLTRGITVGAIK
jgi:raffinose/stachyose/melibiose transport system permease protein